MLVEARRAGLVAAEGTGHEPAQLTGTDGRSAQGPGGADRYRGVLAPAGAGRHHLARLRGRGRAAGDRTLMDASRGHGHAKMALHVGRRMPRVDGKEKVTAAARYTEDLRLPGLLHARLLLSPHPHARIVRVAKEAALAVEGVVAVLLAEDLPIAEDATREEHLLLASGEAPLTRHPVAAGLAGHERARRAGFRGGGGGGGGALPPRARLPGIFGAARHGRRARSRQRRGDGLYGDA